MSKLPPNGPAKVEICNTLDGRQFVPVVIDLREVNTRRRSIKTLLALAVEPETPSHSESKPRAGFDDVPAMLAISQAQPFQLRSRTPNRTTRAARRR